MLDINLGVVNSCNFTAGGYRASPGLTGAFLQPAETVNKDGAIFEPDPFVGKLEFAPVAGSYIEIPRSMVLGMDEKDYQRQKLGLEDTAGLSEHQKFDIVSGIVGQDIARTGILFSEQYATYKLSEVDPEVYKMRGHNVSGLEFNLLVSGIVQKCGTRGTFERLFRMLSLSPESTIAINNLNNPDQVEVKIQSDLISAGLFMGIISPDLFSTGALKSPRIFHVVNLGEFLFPYQLLVSMVGHNAVEMPRGYHVYTINVRDVKIESIKKDEEEVALSEGRRKLFEQSQQLTSDFIVQ